MLIILPAVILIAFLLWSLFKTPKGDHKSMYSKSQNFMDFDPGTDSDKIGNSQYPNACIDSVMKQEFLDDLLDKDKD